MLHLHIDHKVACQIMYSVFSGGKLWDHVGAYFQSLPPTPVHELTMENVYLGKKLIKGEVSEVRSNSARLADRAAAPSVESEDVPLFDDTDSVSSQDQSYLELIRDYASTATKKLFQFGEELYNNSLSIVGNQESCVQGSKMFDKVSEKCVFEVQELNREFEYNAAVSKFQEDSSLSQLPDTVQTVPQEHISSLSQLPDTVQTVPQEHINNSVRNLVPDILPEESTFLLSWKNLESLDTTNLVENSQKLLESVNKTLLSSETVASRLKNEKVAVEEDAVGLTARNKNVDIISNTFLDNGNSNMLTVKEENGAVKGSGTHKRGNMISVAQCKSEDASLAVSALRKERKLSVGRRLSFAAHAKMPLERHFSSDVSTC